jgi:hypothetical protein
MTTQEEEEEEEEPTPQTWRHSGEGKTAAYEAQAMQPALTKKYDHTRYGNVTCQAPASVSMVIKLKAQHHLLPSGEPEPQPWVLLCSMAGHA